MTSFTTCKRLIRINAAASFIILGLWFMLGVSNVRAQAITEDFANITTLPAAGWFTQNNSVPLGSTGWFQGNSAVFPADLQGGADVRRDFDRFGGTGLDGDVGDDAGADGAAFDTCAVFEVEGPRPEADGCDGDGKTDQAIWRNADGNFWVRNTVSGAVNTFQLGASGDFPVANFNAH